TPQRGGDIYAIDGEVIHNCGDPWSGRSRVADMAAGFYANAPDLTLTCDRIRISGNHAAFVWTFTGHDAGTNTPLKIKGWEEWDLARTEKPPHHGAGLMATTTQGKLPAIKRSWMHNALRLGFSCWAQYRAGNNLKEARNGASGRIHPTEGLDLGRREWRRMGVP
ncbi:MAG TPA: nuclear transport factor 2 family protein, partial [Roseibacterium sp.]|nr:nuclear transport factor 2 family protein [Roseibacterium sp.]